MLFYILLTILDICYGLLKHGEYRHMGISCKNNENAAVDWWVIYKPPAGAVSDGRNFSFVAADAEGGWQEPQLITDFNLLHVTLAPLFKKKYADRIAGAVFEETDPDEVTRGSTVRGVMMADTAGGLYLSHTVPDLVDYNAARPKFPEPALKEGHMLVCLSLSLRTLNQLAVYVRHTGLTVQALEVPPSLLIALPAWVYLNSDNVDNTLMNLPSGPLKISLPKSSTEGLLYVRKPGKTNCVFTAFAQKRSVILDVYAPNPLNRKDVCKKTYGIRTINSISVKQHDTSIVNYVNKTSDKARFAVSTAATWQRVVPGRTQYWACFSNLGRDDDAKGGMLLCLHNYKLWATVDNLKVKEPEC